MLPVPPLDVSRVFWLLVFLFYAIIKNEVKKMLSYIFPDLFKQREDNNMPESSATKRVQCLDSVLLYAISPTKRAIVMPFNNSHIKLLSNNFNMAVLKNRIFGLGRILCWIYVLCKVF